VYDYEALEEGLNAINAPREGWLTEEERAQVGDFIEVGEYGLAYEVLSDILDERGVAVPADIYHELVRLGRKMGLDESTWLKLRPLVTEG